MNNASSNPTAPQKDWSLTHEALVLLLSRLDPDPGRAWGKLMELRAKLISYFTFHRGSQPEPLADRTIARVAGKMRAGTDVQNPEAFAMGAAWFVLREDWTSIEAHTFPIEADSLAWPDGSPSPEAALIERERERKEQRRLACMRECFDKLPRAESDLMLQYQQGERRARSEQRAALAVKLGLTGLALRLQVHHVRVRLRACLDDCYRRKASA